MLISLRQRGDFMARHFVDKDSLELRQAVVELWSGTATAEGAITINDVIKEYKMLLVDVSYYDGGTEAKRTIVCTGDGLYFYGSLFFNSSRDYRLIDIMLWFDEQDETMVVGNAELVKNALDSNRTSENITITKVAGIC